MFDKHKKNIVVFVDFGQVKKDIVILLTLSKSKNIVILLTLSKSFG